MRLSQVASGVRLQGAPMGLYTLCLSVPAVFAQHVKCDVMTSDAPPRVARRDQGRSCE